MLDDRVGRVAEPVGIDALLERFGVDLLLGLARPSLQFGINGEFHDASPVGRGFVNVLRRLEAVNRDCLSDLEL